MKVLGIKQFHQKKYKMLAIDNSKFAPTLGNVPHAFILVVYGYSGNGKTEFCMQLAKELTRHGKAAWLSYEQRHGYDLQLATMRNKMQEHVGDFLIIDPIANLPVGKSLIDDLDDFLKKRNSPDFIFLDSLDYMNLTEQGYKYFKEKYEGRKTLIFLAHSDERGKPIKSITRKIIFDGGMGFHIKDFICYPKKNRFGGQKPYVIYEELARERNPLYFAKLESESEKKPPHKRKKKENEAQPPEPNIL